MPYAHTHNVYIYIYIYIYIQFWNRYFCFRALCESKCYVTIINVNMFSFWNVRPSFTLEISKLRMYTKIYSLLIFKFDETKTIKRVIIHGSYLRKNSTSNKCSCFIVHFWPLLLRVTQISQEISCSLSNL